MSPQLPGSDSCLYTHPCLSGCPIRESWCNHLAKCRSEQVKKQPGCRKASGKQVSVTWKLPADSPSCRGCPSQLHQSAVVLGRNAAAAVRMPLFCKSIFRIFQCQISRRANAKCISPSSRSSRAAGAIEFHSFHLYYKYCIVVSFFSLILSFEKNYKALVDWSLWLSTVVKPQAVNTSFNCLRRMYLFHRNNRMKSVRAKESPLSRQPCFSASELNAKGTLP